MSINIKEIKDAACGKDAEGNSKSITIIGAHNYDTANTAADPEVIAEFSSLEPVVSIAIGGEITWISLKFISDRSADLSLYFRTLERYLEEVEKDHENKTPVSFLSIIPVEFAGQYYINAVHPIMWAVEPDTIGDESRTLRIAFFSENIAFLESSLEDDFFAEALEVAKQENNPDNFVVPERNYGQTERDKHYVDSDRFLSDYDDDDDDEDDDDDDDYKDGDSDERQHYVYR